MTILSALLLAIGDLFLLGAISGYAVLTETVSSRDLRSELGKGHRRAAAIGIIFVIVGIFLILS